MEIIAAHGGGPGQGFPCSLLSGTLSSQGASAATRVSKFLQFSSLCVFVTAGPITKLCAWGKEDSGGHVLSDTTSRGLCELG
jgi:hypothetical protein